MKYPYIVTCNGVLYPAGTEVPAGVIGVELTDNIPEGALDENEDGGTNVYDESGIKVGTVSKEEVEQLEAEAGEFVATQPKRGRKAKKE